ncbi:unnamed protein product [Rhodiola kirilowii]
MKHYLFVILMIVVLPLSSCHVSLANQSDFFTQMKKSLQGDALSSWVSVSYCNYSGVVCDIEGFVTKVDIFGWSLVGKFPEKVCSYLPKLRVLRLGHNLLKGKFPDSITNCSFLDELDMSYTDLAGKLPDFRSMKSLKILKFPHTRFTGNFPISIFSLSNLEEININEVRGFNPWELPENLTNLHKLKVCILTSCNLQGHIPPSIGNLTSLNDLELSGNYFRGKVPKEVGQLKNLHGLELYYNQLRGSIPTELGNLTELVDLDMSANLLTGELPESICRLPKLKGLQLYQNAITGEIPKAIGNSTTLTFLSLYSNFLTGKLPHNLGQLSPMITIELSENHLSGELPASVCNGGKLMYLLLLDNNFSGHIPERYTECINLLRFRVSHNCLEGSVPEKLFALPHAFIIDLSYNRLRGSFSKKIAYAANLSELFIQRNMITGPVPSEISRAQNLVKIDLSYNLLSSIIPSEIGNLRKLNILMLQGNKLTSSIPESISSLKSLNLVDLSDNLLTGRIPESLTDLLPNSINLTNNRLSGPIPPQFVKEGLLDIFSGNAGLCVSVNLRVSDSNFPPCSVNHSKKKVTNTWSIVLTLMVIVVVVALLLPHCYLFGVHSSVRYEVRSFCRNSLDPLQLLEGIQEANIIGHGGSGTVYKVIMNNKKTVAIKKLNQHSLDFGFTGWQKETKAEVMTLGGIRHINIIKLYCLLSTLDNHLLVYEYMENGNLWDALHSGNIHMNWITRRQIALGIAQGLAYLHHDLIPPIIHRDIKSSNILLDVDYQPKIADFGIAKILSKTGPDSTTSGIAGTYGYLAPEYSYSSMATRKCDVYSFGVVLMELITGRKVVEEAFGEGSNIVDWVAAKADTIEQASEVLDEQLAISSSEKMFQLLQIAIRCTNKSPTLRPTMKEVLESLLHTKP